MPISRVINHAFTSVFDNSRVMCRIVASLMIISYYSNMFILQATVSYWPSYNWAGQAQHSCSILGATTLSKTTLSISDTQHK